MTYPEEPLKYQPNIPRLTNEEKSLMRYSLATHMRANPLPMKSPWPMTWIRLGSPVFLVMLLLAGTTYAAQGTLPGDTLYPVKIHLNERVEVALTTTKVEKAKVEAALAKRRVTEAQTLALRGTLDATTTNELQTNFDAHASEALALVTQSENTETSKKKIDLAVSTTSPVSVSAATATSTPTSTITTQTGDSDALASALRTSLTVQATILNNLKLQVTYRTAKAEMIASTTSEHRVYTHPNPPKPQATSSTLQ